MEDVRVSVRLTKELHEKLKILAIKRNTNMNKLLVDYIVKLVDEDEEHEKKESN